MRVGMDYRPAMQPSTGIGRYVTALARELAGDGCDVRLYGCFFRGNRPERRRAPDGTRLVAWPVPSRVMGWLARPGLLPTERALGGIDLFHHTNYLLPEVRRRTPQVMTIHDLAFFRDGFHAPAAMEAMRDVLRRAVDRCAVFCVPSEATARDCEELLRLPRDRLFLTPLGVDDAFFHLPAPGPPLRRTLLSVGTLEPRKNLARLVRAFARSGVDADLVLAGGAGWMCDDVLAEVRARPNVRVLGWVHESELRRLLAGATAVAYPSLLEGFGLPVLEAMAAGKPVLTSDREPFRSVTGGAALLVDPEDEDALADAVRRIIEDEGVRGPLQRAGPEQARRFPWAACAAATKRAYEAALQR